MTTPICPSCGSTNTRTLNKKLRGCDDCSHSAPSQDFKKHAIRPESVLSGSQRIHRAPSDQDEQP